MNIICSAISHKGLIRENNEDNLYINGKFRNDIGQDIITFDDECDDRAVLAVLDGMGGESFGEIASLIAAERLAGFSAEDLIGNPQQYIDSANLKICNEIEKNEGRQSGTTVALLVIYENKATIVNVGDSRIYRFKDESLERLSKDHTRAQQMVDAGILTEEETRGHQLKHILTQHLGVDPEDYILEPYLCEDIPLAPGDIFVICSDGLTDMLTDSEICEIIKQDKEIGQLAEELLEKALAAGGRDNITVVAAKIG